MEDMLIVVCVKNRSKKIQKVPLRIMCGGCQDGVFKPRTFFCRLFLLRPTISSALRINRHNSPNRNNLSVSLIFYYT